MQKLHRPYGSIEFDFKEQIKLLGQVSRREISLKFIISKDYPSFEKIDDLVSILDKNISCTNTISIQEKELLIELQLGIFLAIFSGIMPNQFLNWKYSHWSKAQNIKYQNKKIDIIAKNIYADKLVDKLKEIRIEENRVPNRTLFQKLNNISFLTCLNLLLILNGIEETLSIFKLKILFGRFLYLKHGRINSVRDFLSSYYKSNSHIELLLDLKLVSAITKL